MTISRRYFIGAAAVAAMLAGLSARSGQQYYPDLGRFATFHQTGANRRFREARLSEVRNAILRNGSGLGRPGSQLLQFEQHRQRPLEPLVPTRADHQPVSNGLLTKGMETVLTRSEEHLLSFSGCTAMTIYGLKRRFQDILRPLVERLAIAGITANQVTLAACVLSLAMGGLLVWQADKPWLFLLLPVALLLRLALNAADGMLAREFDQKSHMGAYLNEICDVVSDAALYAPIALIAPFASAWVGAVILLSALTEFAGVLGPMIGASRRYDGPMGKSDRALVFGALGLWIGIGGPLPVWVSWLMPVVSALLIVTIVNRVRAGLGESSGGRRPGG